MRKISFALAVLLITALGTDASELYRWVDKGGVVHYSDHPVEDADRLKFKDEPVQSESAVDQASIPYEARMASQHFPVTLYVIEQCDDTCQQAKNYLKKRKIPYTETVLKTQEEFEEFRKKSGLQGVPSLSVGRNWLGGFQEGRWKSELDAAGYPN